MTPAAAFVTLATSTTVRVVIGRACAGSAQPHAPENVSPSGPPATTAAPWITPSRMPAPKIRLQARPAPRSSVISR